jgi:hypothetical protein
VISVPPLSNTNHFSVLKVYETSKAEENKVTPITAPCAAPLKKHHRPKWEKMVGPKLVIWSLEAGPNCIMLPIVLRFLHRRTLDILFHTFIHEFHVHLLFLLFYFDSRSTHAVASFLIVFSDRRSIHAASSLMPPTPSAASMLRSTYYKIPSS